MWDNARETLAERVGKRLSLEEYFVDFLGGLVPGVLFLVGSTLALIPAFHMVLWSIQPDNRTGLFQALGAIVTAIKQTPSALWIVFFLGASLLAYVVGHIFYRHDPKTVDRKSFNKLVGSVDNMSDDDKRADLGCRSADDCEFPYPHYDDYLERRGLEHLKKLVVWRGDRFRRSKTYINLLKIRLRHHYPEKCGTIVRNEAHVRLASSTWYVARLLTKMSLVSLVVCVVAGVISIVAYANHESALIREIIVRLVTDLLAPGTVFMLSLYATKAILGFLHYQRLREVFYVLETAYTAFKDNPHLLNPPFTVDSLTARTRHAGVGSGKEGN